MTLFLGYDAGTRTRLACPPATGPVAVFVLNEEQERRNDPKKSRIAVGRHAGDGGICAVLPGWSGVGTVGS
ncbi:MAG: hypothetical protein M3O50_16615, partial [Myxococcota bacterium]|nr:hypothetical protein [Myxococcota bacterium]